MAYTVSPGSKTGSGPAAVAGSLYTRRGLRKYLTRDERQRVMAVCGDAPTDAKLLALTLLWTGARVSEVLALVRFELHAAQATGETDRLWSCSRVTAWRQVKALLAAAGIRGEHACPRGL